ncbi:MAG: GAF domain-containing protein [Reyranella sp.]|nr:GAF domain-containing protein [Reyranella sp.]
MAWSNDPRWRLTTTPDRRFSRLAANDPARPTPAFGEADLSNCEREQIQFAASIQPHGALLVVSEPERIIVQASENAAEFLGLDASPVGLPLGDLPGDLGRSIRPHLDDPLHKIPRAVRCTVGRPAAAFDGLLHRPPAGGLVVELERAGPSVDLSQNIEQSVQTILSAATLRALCDDTAAIFKRLTSYDRVMVYRFDSHGHGEVIAERREPELEAFLGNRYPSSDIPQVARHLYERNRVRVLVDVNARPAPVLPRFSPATGKDLDMSMCFLRAMSPIHIQYLKNMGVGATLVASLMVGGKLWGLISCHHYSPRFVHFEVRAVCELLAEAVGTRIAALESFAQAQIELSVRRIEQRLVTSVSREGDWKQALFDGSQTLLQPVGASGAALLFEGQLHVVGDVPGTQELRDIGALLDHRASRNGSDNLGVFSTEQLSVDEPEFASIRPVASGLLATRVSTSPGEYLMWFRPEQIRTVTWGGDPQKPYEVGNDPSDLSPRRSFAQWHQLVENTSQPWSAGDLVAGRLIGETVADVVLQLRSVRMLIAQHQLEQVSQEVERAGQPVIICNSNGAILLANEAFERLLVGGRPKLQSLDDLAPLFTDPTSVRRRLRDLITRRDAWRSEASLKLPDGGARPLLVRADPVQVSPDKMLGYVILFFDLTERKMADVARRDIQAGLVDRRRLTNVRLDSKGDLTFQNMLSPMIENAQLAALEITDGIDVSQMPELLHGVRASVTRSAEVLEQLVWHASRTSDDET